MKREIVVIVKVNIIKNIIQTLKVNIIKVNIRKHPLEILILIRANVFYLFQTIFRRIELTIISFPSQQH